MFSVKLAMELAPVVACMAILLICAIWIIVRRDVCLVVFSRAVDGHETQIFALGACLFLGIVVWAWWGPAPLRNTRVQEYAPAQEHHLRIISPCPKGKPRVITDTCVPPLFSDGQSAGGKYRLVAAHLATNMHDWELFAFIGGAQGVVDVPALNAVAASQPCPDEGSWPPLPWGSNRSRNFAFVTGEDASVYLLEVVWDGEVGQTVGGGDGLSFPKCQTRGVNQQINPWGLEGSNRPAVADSVFGGGLPGWMFARLRAGLRSNRDGRLDGFMLKEGTRIIFRDNPEAARSMRAPQRHSLRVWGVDILEVDI